MKELQMPNLTLNICAGFKCSKCISNELLLGTEYLLAHICLPV